QLRAADAEVAPSPPRQLARLALARAVPSFHRQNAEPVADAHAANVERLRKRRRRRGRQLLVESESNARALQMRAKCGGRLERGDPRIAQSSSLIPACAGSVPWRR